MLAPITMEYRIREYGLQQGALEIEYIEEYFGEFPSRKTATEVVRRLDERDHQILMAEAPLPDDPGTVVPVAYKVSHEIRIHETEPKLADLVARLQPTVEFQDRKVLYNWLGGTRRDWRGRGFFRALTEEQEAWAHDNGFSEIVDDQQRPRAEARRQQALDRQPPLCNEEPAVAHQRRVRDDAEVVQAGIVDGGDPDAMDRHGYADRTTCRRLRCRSSTSRPMRLLR